MKCLQLLCDALSICEQLWKVRVGRFSIVGLTLFTVFIIMVESLMEL